MPTRRRHTLKKLALCALIFSPAAFAQNEATQASVRETRPNHVFVSAGTPSASWIGFSYGYQINPQLEVVGSYGRTWVDELRVNIFNATARVLMFDSPVTPLLGAGASVFQIGGTGKFQDLDTSTMLGTLLIGLDAHFEPGFRLSAGWTFHYPIALHFPFVDIGYTF